MTHPEHPSSKLPAEPPNQNGQPPPNNTDSTICGKKFQAMLSCVERTGAVNACTEKVNDFLACERNVFRTALRKTSVRQEPTPRHIRSGRPMHPMQTPTNPASRYSSNAAKPSSNAGQPDDEHERQPFDFFGAPMASLERVVKKQIGACENLVETLGKPNYQTQLLNFNRRMLTDMRVTCEIIRSKAVQLAHRVWRKSDSDESGNPGN